MKPWEIWTWQNHPCVVISCAGRVERKARIAVLGCQTLYSGDKPPRENEALLDASDGLDRNTICTCDLPYTVEKSSVNRKRGTVSMERRRDISRKLIQGLAIAGL